MGVRKQKSMIEKAQDVAHEVADQVKPQVEAATGKAVGLAQEGMKHAGPAVGQGKAVAGGVIAQVVDAAADAAEHAQHFVEEKAQDAGLVEKKKKKGGKFRKFLLFGALTAVIGVVAKKLSEKKEANKWQPASPAPAPKAAPTAAAAAAGAGAKESDDVAGADPAEALSDSVDTPHAVTTPDDPADVVDVPPVEGYSTGDKPSQG